MAIEKCPRCLASVRMIAGLECPKCHYRLYTQNLDTDWSLQNFDGIKRAKAADEQAKPDKSHNPKRRNPLDFRS